MQDNIVYYDKEIKELNDIIDKVYNWNRTSNEHKNDAFEIIKELNKHKNDILSNNSKLQTEITDLLKSNPFKKKIIWIYIQEKI